MWDRDRGKKLEEQIKMVGKRALPSRAEEVVARVKRETGITIVAFLERLLEWYAAQDPRIGAMIVSPYREVRQGLAKLGLFISVQ